MIAATDYLAPVEGSTIGSSKSMSKISQMLSILFEDLFERQTLLFDSATYLHNLSTLIYFSFPKILHEYDIKHPKMRLEVRKYHASRVVDRKTATKTKGYYF